MHIVNVLEKKCSSNFKCQMNLKVLANEHDNSFIVCSFLNYLVITNMCKCEIIDIFN